MSADSFDGFDYEPDRRVADAETRRRYWATAIGLQAVDGLEVSPYLHELARAYEAGSYTLEQTGRLVRAYHESADSPATREADLVSQRIAEMLERGSFAFAPDMLNAIHRQLFQDLEKAAYLPGQFKTERLVKQEDILNGDSVLYADPGMIQLSLDYLFREEVRAAYPTSLEPADVARLARFIALIWQVHPFVEGNTRTVAVFSELYLASLGFSVTNEPFEQHARYFRDALVRANYRNNAAAIAPDPSFINAFYENLLLDAGRTLDRADLICTQLFDDPRLLKNIPPHRAIRP